MEKIAHKHNDDSNGIVSIKRRGLCTIDSIIITIADPVAGNYITLTANGDTFANNVSATVNDKKEKNKLDLHAVISGPGPSPC